MKKKPPLFLYILLTLLAGCSLAAFLSGGLDTAGIFTDPVRLWKRIVRPLMRLTVFISIGLFVGQFIEGIGWTDRLGVMARPFMRWGHLSRHMGAVFTTAFFSGTTSLSMLMSFHQEGKLSRREITLSVLLNTFPSFFLHLPTTFFIILPLVGKAGAIYLLLTFGAALLRLGAALTCTHFMLPESSGYYHEKSAQDKEWKKLVRETGKKFISRLTNILMIVLPVYLIIVLISDMGFFLWLRKSLALGITSTFVPIDAMSIVIFSLLTEFTSGYAAAGAMLDTGTLTIFQTVIALLLGNLIAAPVRALRHQMPYYMGIFSPGLGVRLMLASQSLRIGSLIIAGLIYVFVMNMFILGCA
ncbi:MAG: nucleoside recognition protein [Deltaproteobacteria bacterium]|nr:nucleoside recognition protein [Deltaproteobacteria bacterium]